MPPHAPAIFLACFCWSAWNAAAYAEEVSVPVDYQSRQIQLAGRFEKPPGPARFL